MKTLKARFAIFMTLFCLAFTTTAIADNNDLRGIWSIESTDYIKIEGNIVFYKIFNKDGTFITLRSADKGKTFIIASKGEYEMQMPGAYIETFDKKSTNVLATNANTITFKKNGDKLNLTFKIGGKDYSEVWKKTSIPTIR